MFACIRVNACVLIRPTSYDVFSEVRSRSKVIKELNIHEFSAMDQWEAAHSGPALNLPDRDFAWFKKSHTIATLLRGQPQNGGVWADLWDLSDTYISISFQSVRSLVKKT